MGPEEGTPDISAILTSATDQNTAADSEVSIEKDVAPASQDDASELPALRNEEEKTSGRINLPSEIPDSEAMYDDWSHFNTSYLRSGPPPLRDEEGIASSPPSHPMTGVPEIKRLPDLVSVSFGCGSKDYSGTPTACSQEEEEVVNREVAEDHGNELAEELPQEEEAGLGTTDTERREADEATLSSSIAQSEGVQAIAIRDFEDDHVPFGLTPSQELTHNTAHIPSATVEAHGDDRVQMSSIGDQTAELIDILAREKGDAAARDHHGGNASSASVGSSAVQSEPLEELEGIGKETGDSFPSLFGSSPGSVSGHGVVLEENEGPNINPARNEQNHEIETEQNDVLLPDTQHLGEEMVAVEKDASSHAVPSQCTLGQATTSDIQLVPSPAEVWPISKKGNDDDLPNTAHLNVQATTKADLNTKVQEEEPMLQASTFGSMADITASDPTSVTGTSKEQDLPATQNGELEITPIGDEVSGINDAFEDEELPNAEAIEFEKVVNREQSDTTVMIAGVDEDSVHTNTSEVEMGNARNTESSPDMEEPDEVDLVPVLTLQPKVLPVGAHIVPASDEENEDEELPDAPEPEVNITTESLVFPLVRTDSAISTLHILVNFPPSSAPEIPDSDDDEELPDAPAPSNLDSAVKIENEEVESVKVEILSSPPKIPRPPDNTPDVHTPSQSFLGLYPQKKLRPMDALPTVPSPRKSDATGSTKRKLAVTPTSSFPVPNSGGAPDKDVLMTELKAMKIASIQARNASLEAEIAAKKAKLAEITKELKNPAAETVKRHIKLLHDYNDIRDVGQGLVGMIADNRGVRIGELYEEFGVGLKD